jgi:pSer/pThr/pTyr-binding forkhead associated (FHA) protein
MHESAGESRREGEPKLPPPVHLLVKLELPDRPAREFSYDFRQAVISLGRDPSNDIQVPLTTVSRRHARIFYEHGDYFLEDLGSTHGTDHNGRKLTKGEKKLLRDGDSIAIMSFSISFKTTAGTLLDRQPGEKTEQLARRMVQEVLSTLGSKSEPAALRVMNGPDEGKRFEISEEQVEVTIGRSPDCDLPLNDQNISRRHCLIKRNWHAFTAQDLGSKNGVLVNGKKIEGQFNLKDGDDIQIGGVKLVFIDPPSRLLDQFGGLNGETVDGRADDHGASAENGAAEDQGDEDGAAEREPMQDPQPEMDVEPPGGGGDGNDMMETAPPPDFGIADPELLKQVNAEIEKATKRSAFEVIVLLCGAMFLFGAIALIVFLVM